MTKAKFRRLFIVLLGPLLVAGGSVAALINSESIRVNLRCAPLLFAGSDSCRSTGWGEFDERVANEYQAWFEVNTRSYEDNSFPWVYTSASQRMVDDVQILEVSPYMGTDDRPGSSLSNLRALRGQKISIVFGVSNDRYRAFNPLGCNELNFDTASPGEFEAGLCGIPNGLARVRFTVGSAGQMELKALKTAIDEVTVRERRGLIMTYLFITPSFVILFLMMSGVFWIVRRAALYVAAA